MNTTCSVYIATSVDGYIAGPDGDISWLEKPEYQEGGTPGISYEAFIRTVDGIVMGRNTYEKVLTFGFWPYENIPVTVLISRKLSISDNLRGKVTIASGPPDEIVRKLASAGQHHLYIDGGVTIQRFLQAGLIDQLIITKIPVLLGKGIPLFSDTDIPVNLHLADVNSGSNGFVQLHYRLKK